MINHTLILAMVLVTSLSAAADPLTDALGILHSAADEAEQAAQASAAPWMAYWSDGAVLSLHDQVAGNRPDDDADKVSVAEMAALQLLGIQTDSAYAQAIEAATRRVETARARALDADDARLRRVRGQVTALRALKSVRTTQSDHLANIRARFKKLPAGRQGLSGERYLYIRDLLSETELAFADVARQMTTEQEILAKDFPGSDPLAEASEISDRAEQYLHRIAIAAAIVDRYASGLHAEAGWPTLTMNSTNGELIHVDGGDMFEATGTVELREAMKVSTGTGTATVRWPDGSLVDLAAGTDLVVRPTDAANPLELMTGAVRITGSLAIKISGGAVVKPVGQSVVLVTDGHMEGYLSPGSRLLSKWGKEELISAATTVRTWHVTDGLVTSANSTIASWDAWRTKLETCQ